MKHTQWQPPFPLQVGQLTVKSRHLHMVELNPITFQSKIFKNPNNQNNFSPDSNSNLTTYFPIFLLLFYLFFLTFSNPILFLQNSQVISLYCIKAGRTYIKNIATPSHAAYHYILLQHLCKHFVMLISFPLN